MKKNSLTHKILGTDLLPAAKAPSYAKAMTRTVNISEAKANLSKLADDVASGEEVIVSRSGKPLMKWIALNPEELEAAKTKPHYRKLGPDAKYLENFDWEQWDRLDDEMRIIWRKFGYMV